jgi:hypothetical protein
LQGALTVREHPEGAIAAGRAEDSPAGARPRAAEVEI